MKISNLRIQGQQQPVTAPVNQGEWLNLDASYAVNGWVRGVPETHTVTLGDDKLAEFVFEDNTSWLCSSDTIGELFPEATVQKRAADDAFDVPLVLRNTTDTLNRGIVTDIAVKLINIFTRNKVPIVIKEAAEKFELQKLGNAPGLYRLDEKFQLQTIDILDTGKPFLLFLHGTASSTSGSFAGLLGSDVWRSMLGMYGDNILAFQHRSLTESPLQNIAGLVQLLPDNITLHLISHSRGGLLGDILSRFCSSNDKSGFTKEEQDYLRKLERDDDLANIAGIQQAVKNKNIFVKKFIRVACPAGGTILASKRMDIYFNVLANLTGLLTGGVAGPLLLAFKNLVAAVLYTKADTQALPGIEAMNPESAFIKVLNNPSTTAAIDGPLAIVSGNCGVDFSLKALRTIAMKLFFLEQNDLVVNSDSMYLGTRRTEKVQFFFDESGEVDHFHYFINKKTANAILLALQAGPAEDIAGFKPFTQPSAAPLRALEGGELFADNITGKRPIVVLLPGIMGSNIGPRGDLLWINYLRFIGGGLMDLKDTSTNTATSLVKTSYKKLKDFLSQTYDVVAYPFDWRLSLPDVTGLFDQKINALLSYNQPIKIIGHSMGGVLVRDFIVNHRDTWQRLNNSPGFRLVFLGAPLGGSFRIPYVLFGKDSIIKKLSLIDIHHTKRELLEMFSQMPGLLSLLPMFKNGEDDLADSNTWDAMRHAFGDDTWPVPGAALLEAFSAHRSKVTTGIDAADYANAVYVAGQDKSTPLGYLIEEDTNGKELVFLSTAEGDQSVTWDSGIPKQMLANDTVYYAPVSHGALANEPSLFKGIAELLEKGSTGLLSKKRPVVRGEEKIFRTPEVHDFDLSAESVENTLLGLNGGMPAVEASEMPIRVKVSNGDLLYASYPVLAGHFEDDAILYAESAIDWYLGGILKKKQQLGVYPGKIGTCEVVVTANDQLKGAVITGLGKPGTLNAFLLSLTVEQGVASYLLDLNNQRTVQSQAAAGQRIGISSLIIGCGYGGLAVENSVRSIVQGIQHANSKVKKLYGENCLVVEEIEFVEKDEDKALACFYSLSRIAAEQSRYLNIALDNRKINKLLGSTKRMPVEASEEWWNRITVKAQPKTEAGCNEIKCLQFSASTGGAREELRELFSSTAILEELVNDISTQNNWSPALAKTIFELIIPNDFKEQLKKQCNINWILDKDTAAYPWELLQDSATNAQPLCINAGMIRQLATDNYRLMVNAVVRNTALVISEPDLQGAAPPLPGAAEEGLRVAGILKEKNYALTHVAKGTAPEIIRALFQSDYKIIHLAGHGVFNDNDPCESGMLIGKNVLLTTREIIQMSAVPELVFVNCCFLGKTNGAAEELYSKRYKLAANIGTQLIENGVKAVIAAGWAVNDAAATAFTETFYQSMFAGYSFGDAVLKARKTVYENYPGTNTWGAYQCYGDPFYKLDPRDRVRKQAAPEYIIAQQAEYDLYNLANELEMGYSALQSSDKLHAISVAVDKASIRDATITEKEALIYAELGLYKEAIAKFETLLKMEKASFSFLCMEKYCSVRGQKYVADYIQSGKENRSLYETIDEVITDINYLLRAGATAGRYSLLGATYKRKALLAPDQTAKEEACKKALFNFSKAMELATDGDNVYPVGNWLELACILAARGITNPTGAETQTSIETQKNELLKKLASPEVAGADGYLNGIALANIKLCLLLLDKSSAKDLAAWNSLAADFRRAWKKAGSPGKKLAAIEHLQFLADAFSMESMGGNGAAKHLQTAIAAVDDPGVYLEPIREAVERAFSFVHN